MLEGIILALKIGVLGDIFLLYEKAGIFHYGQKILEGLHEIKSDITLFSPSTDCPSELKKVNTVIADYFNVGKIKNTASIQNFPFFTRNLKLTSDIHKQVDVLYSPQCRISDLSFFLNLRIPMLTTLHDLHAFMSDVPLLYKMRFILRYVSPKVLLKKRKIFLATPTLSIKNQLVRNLHISPNKIKIVPAAVASPLWTLKLSKEHARDIVEKTIGVRHYVLFLGRQSQVQPFLSTIKSLKKDFHLSVQGVIAGIGVNPLATKKLITQLGLEKNVLVLGHISERLKWILFRGATVFIFPNYPEGGFGIPPVEAMNVGTPVVVSNDGPLPEIVGDAGLLAKNEKELVECVYHCYLDGNLRNKLCQKGFERAKFFQPKNVASCLMGHLNDIMAN